jgi:hypothetical protein
MVERLLVRRLQGILRSGPQQEAVLPDGLVLRLARLRSWTCCCPHA